VTKLLAIATGVGVAAATFAALGRSSPEAASAEIPALRAELAQMSQAIAALQHELRALRHEQRAQLDHREPAPAEPVDDADAVAAQPPAPAEPEDPAERVDRYAASADRVLAKQPRDVSWAEARALPQRLGAILPSGSQIRAIECGTSLCRVETRHRTRDAYRAFLTGMNPEPKNGQDTLFWNGAAMYLQIGESDDPQAEVLAVAYLTRGDTPLPPMPE
jgi:hypothetical protein